MRLILNVLVLALVLGSVQSCVSKKKYDELAAAKEQTDQALAETQENVKNLEAENEQLKEDMESEKERLNGELAGIKEDLESTKSNLAQVQEKLNMTEAELNRLKDEINGMMAAYEDAGLKMEARDGRLYLVTDEKIQYSSGSTRLSRDERKALDALADKLKSNEDLRILVEGHTDNVPVKADAAIGDNWNLSIFRAKGVVQYLLRKGVSSSQVALVGRGDTMPAASNDDAEGRAQNRRTVIKPDADFGKLIEN